MVDIFYVRSNKKRLKASLRSFQSYRSEKEIQRSNKKRLKVIRAVELDLLTKNIENLKQ